MQTLLRPLSRNHYFSPDDRGYALAPWLMTPLVNPQTRQERSYNEHHLCTRAVVKRTTDVLKARWMCLDTAGGKLLFTPEKACQIIFAGCVLHNIAVKEGVPFPDPAPAENVPEDPPHAIMARQQLTARL